MWNVIKARGREVSTYRGLAAIMAACGVMVAPEQVDAIGTLGVAAIGLIEVLRQEQVAR